MSQQAHRLLTVDDFLTMPEYDERYELLDGRLVEKPLPKYKHSLVATRIRDAWKAFDPQEIGGTMLPEVSVRIALGYAPTPDMSYWIAARRPAQDVDIAPRPDLAIEVLSKNQAVQILLDKANRYLRAGSALVWIIQPDKQDVIVFRQGQAGYTTIQPDGELDGENVIPGFKLPLSKLFE